MNSRLRKLSYVFTSGVLLFLSVSITAMVVRSRSQGGETIKEQVTNKLPPVTSAIHKLKVVNAEIKNQGEPSASAVIEIRNDSDVAVTGFTVTFGDVSVGKDGGIFTDQPETVIEPRGTTTLDIPLTNLEKDVSIIITAVLYADGTEGGRPLVLKRMHEYRDKEKAKRDGKKGGQNQ